MTRWSKTFLLWLLICLVPLQVVAASVRASCGPDHQAAAPSRNAIIHGVAIAASHHEGMTHEGMTHEGMTYVHAAPAEAGHTATGHDHAHQHKSAFCSTCGNCCVGAFAPPSKIDWEFPATKVPIDIVTPAALVTGYIPNGLERPPRHAPA